MAFRSRIASIQPALRIQNQVLTSQVPIRMFAREVIDDNTPLMDKEMIKRELELFDKLPAEQKEKMAL